MREEKKVRVRFAPSPTGYLHVGGARTAIFNWLFARHSGGDFVLRIEDTDAERSTKESEATLIDDLKWLGLEWDEGPVKGGGHGPYRQTERVPLYKEMAEALTASGNAYPCFCTDELLESKRQHAMRTGQPPHYDGTCRELSADEVKEKRSQSIPESVRFVVPQGKVIIDDVVRGPVEMDTDMVGDFVILRSNGLPTYNFAAAIDDHRMQISHVVRGEEHLPNTLRQILIYDALGAGHPAFAHVPLILADDRSKLSKRHGSSSIDELRAGGFLASAVVNYLVLLGWSHPEEKEVLSRMEMIASFSLDRVGKAAAVFDHKKLLWMNGQHIRQLDVESFVAMASERLPDSINERYGETERREILSILQDNIETLSDIAPRTSIFSDDVVPDDEAAHVIREPSAQSVIAEVKSALEAHADPLTPEGFKALMKTAGKSAGVKGKELFFPIRGAVTGSVHGPDLSRVASVKGKESVVRLLERATRQ